MRIRDGVMHETRVYSILVGEKELVTVWAECWWCMCP